MQKSDYLNTEFCTKLIERNFPQLQIECVRLITHGWDSVVLDVNDTLIFRFPRRDDVVAYLEKERRLLPVLEPELTVAIPRFVYFGRGDETYPYEFVGYQKVSGTALEHVRLNEQQFEALAVTLGQFLSELHGFPVERAVATGMEDVTMSGWREVYRERYLDLQRRVFPRLEEELVVSSRRIWEGFLENERLFHFEPRLIHADLSDDHIFCDPEQGVLTGVIDWGDATIGDPALDFVGLHREYGRRLVERVLEHYRRMVDEAFWERMAFYLQYEPFSELLYGAYGDEGMFEKGRARLRGMVSASAK